MKDEGINQGAESGSVCRSNCDAGYEAVCFLSSRSAWAAAVEGATGLCDKIDLLSAWKSCRRTAIIVHDKHDTPFRRGKRHTSSRENL